MRFASLEMCLFVLGLIFVLDGEVLSSPDIEDRYVTVQGCC